MGVSTIIDDFYTIKKDFVRDASKVVPGQIVWIPFAYIPKVTQIIEISRVDQKDLYLSEFIFKNYDPNVHFTPRSRLTVPALKLTNNEEALFYKAKFRPCVLIEKSVQLGNSADFGKTQNHQTYAVGQFIPIFGVHTPQDQKGLPAVIAQRSDRLEYREFFFMPAFNCAGSKTSKPLEGGIARLDRFFSYTLDSNSVDITDVCLGDEPLQLLKTWFSIYCGFPQTKEQIENLKALTELIQST